MRLNSSMKLGILTTSISRQSGGLLSAVSSLSVSLLKACCRVELFSGNDSDTNSDLKHWRGVETNILAKRGPSFLGFMPALNSVLLSAELDILHVHGLWMYSSIASMIWSMRSNNNYIISPHGMLDQWALSNSGWKKRLAGWSFENVHLRNAACIHALCTSEYKSIREYGLRNPVAVIPNGIELPVSTELLPEPLWTKDLEEDSKVLLFLSRIHPKKGLVNLLHAWTRVCCTERVAADKWRLVVAGWDQDNHQAELERLVLELNIAESVKFVGPQFDAEKAASLTRADAFVLPSFSEGLPMSVLEAWSYRLPVLMSRQCNLPEGFDFKAAIDVEPNTDSIAKGLSTLFNLSEEDRAAMGQRGRNLVEVRFTWPTIAAEMCAVYKWILGRGQKPSCVITD